MRRRTQVRRLFFTPKSIRDSVSGTKSLLAICLFGVSSRSDRLFSWEIHNFQPDLTFGALLAIELSKIAEASSKTQLIVAIGETSMRSLLRNAVLAFVALFAWSATPAFAVPITLTFTVSDSVSFQQTVNNPCVIGDPSCKEPAGMDYTSYSGTPPATGGVYDAYSPTYTTADLTTFTGGTSFKIGIDDNFSNTNETLDEFTVWACTSGCTSFTSNFFDPSISHDAALIAAGYTELYKTTTTYLLNTQNGNGYSDAFSSSVSTSPNTLYVFESKISGDNDGMEENFLIRANATPVPEPTSLLLLGTGILGGARAFKRRMKS